MSKTLIIAEKPSVANDIARVIGGCVKKDDHHENDEYVIGSAVGLAMGIGLMMLPGIRQDVQKGANKVKKAVQDMSEGQQ